MPRNRRGDIVPRNYEHLLPKEEAAGAAVVGCLAWLFALSFICMWIVLDLPNIHYSAMIFNRNIKLIWEAIDDGRMRSRF